MCPGPLGICLAVCKAKGILCLYRGEKEAGVSLPWTPGHRSCPYPSSCTGFIYPGLRGRTMTTQGD